MKNTQTICDVCKATVTQSQCEPLEGWMVIIIQEQQVSISREIRRLDLCPDCAKHFRAWSATGVARRSNVQEET